MQSNTADGYNYRPVVHDHFDGSAHCVECGGPCRQPPAEMSWTVMIRWLLEGEVIQGCQMPHLVERYLLDIKIDLPQLRGRAKETHQRAIRGAM